MRESDSFSSSGVGSSRDQARTVSHLPQMITGDVVFSAEQLVLMGRYPHAVTWTESASDRQVVEDAMARCGCLGGNVETCRNQPRRINPPRSIVRSAMSAAHLMTMSSSRSKI